MKAAYIEGHGGPEVLTVGELPEPPSPGRGEVRLRVKAAALNHLDIWVRRGRPGMASVLPHVLGSDCCGVVESVGEGVDTVSEGDEVILNPGLHGDDEFTRRGEQNISPTYGIMGAHRQGTFAEFVIVRADKLLPKPEHLSHEEAAALPLAHITAWCMLMRRARLQPGETVLIHGIGGGAALAALQLADLAGAQAIVTSSSHEKLDRSVTLGAAGLIHYREEDVAESVMTLTDGRGVDVVFDAVGASTWPINMAATRRGGRIVHCGVTTGAEATVNIAQLYWNHLTVMGSTMGCDEDFRQLVSAVNGAVLTPVVDAVYPLEEAAKAQERMETGQQFGKLVLRIGE